MCNRITEGEVVAHALEIYIDASCRRLPDLRRKRLSGYFNPREKKDKIRVFWRYIYLIDLLIGEKWVYFYGVFLRDNGMIRI